MDTERVRDAIEAFARDEPRDADRDDPADRVRTVRTLHNYLDALAVATEGLGEAQLATFLGYGRICPPLLEA